MIDSDPEMTFVSTADRFIKTDFFSLATQEYYYRKIFIWEAINDDDTQSGSKHEFSSCAVLSV